MRCFIYPLFSLLACALSTVAFAQEGAVHSSPIEIMPDHIVRRILYDEPEQAITRLRDEGRVQEGVIVGTKRWNGTASISVCFFGGSGHLRRQIVEVASEWERQGAPIQFDFGDRQNPSLCRANRSYDIRVGYTQPGYWSLIGQDSLVHVGQFEQSMNFTRFDYAPPSPVEFRRIVLHEFGHALGFNHEHQQERVGCENEFSWPDVYDYLRGPPNNWSKETIDFNLRSRQYIAGDVVSDFDPRSIMLYTFPVNFYKKNERSRCYSKGNVSLSQGDVKLLISAYGAGARSPSASGASLVSAGKDILSTSEQASLQERVTLFNSDLATKAQVLAAGNKRYTDIDIKACSTTKKTLDLVEAVTQVLNVEPKVGLLRYRGIATDDKKLSSIVIYADSNHPEIVDARRLLKSLSTKFAGAVRIAENAVLDRWLLTIVVCD